MQGTLIVGPVVGTAAAVAGLAWWMRSLLSQGTSPLSSRLPDDSTIPSFQEPSPTPGPSPVASPTVSLITSPVSSPVATPGASPVASPAVSPITPPVASPAVSQITPPVASPVESPAVSPITQPVASPVESPAVSPRTPPVASPVESPAPVALPAVSPTTPPVASPAVFPITPPVATPVALPVALPAVSPITPPVASSVVSPIVSAVQQPSLTNFDLPPNVIPAVRTSPLTKPKPASAPQQSTVTNPLENALMTIVAAVVPSRLWQVLRRNIRRKTRGQPDTGLRQYYEAMASLIRLARVYIDHPTELMSILAVPKTQPDRAAIESPLTITQEALAQKYGVPLATIQGEINNIYSNAFSIRVPILEQLQRMVQPKIPSRPVTPPMRASPVVPPVVPSAPQIRSSPIVVPRIPQSVAVQDPFNTACLEQSGWEITGFFAKDFKSLLNSRPNIDVDSLSSETAQLATEHLQDLYWDTVSPLEDNIPMRSLSRNSTTLLTLGNIIGRGASGMVFTGQLQHLRGITKPAETREVLVKVIDSQEASALESQEMVNEILLQSILWCTSQDLKLVPNPIPAIRAPLELHAAPPSIKLRNPGMRDTSKGTPAVAMDFAGKTLQSVMMELQGSPEGEMVFWLLIVSLAESLQALQRAVNFVHTDLHSGNVLAERLSAPQEIILGGVRYSLPYKVSIIDFGKSCLDIGDKTLVTSSRYKQWCVKTGGYDLMLLLSTISMDTMWTDVRLPLMELCKSAFTEQGKKPPLWVFDSLETDYFQGVWRTTTVTTPTNVIKFCTGQLERLSTPVKKHQRPSITRPRVVPQATKPNVFDWRALAQDQKSLRGQREQQRQARQRQEQRRQAEELRRRQYFEEEAQKEEQTRRQREVEVQQILEESAQRWRENRRLEQQEREREALEDQRLDEEFRRWLDERAERMQAQEANDRAQEALRAERERVSAQRGREAQEQESLRAEEEESQRQRDRQRRAAEERAQERSAWEQAAASLERERAREGPREPQRMPKTKRRQPIPVPAAQKSQATRQVLARLKEDMNLVCDQFLNRFGAKDYKQLIRTLHPDKVVQTKEAKRNFLTTFYSPQVDDAVLNDKEVTDLIEELVKKAFDCRVIN